MPPLADYSLTTINNALLLANILLIVNFLIKRWTTCGLVKYNCTPLTIALILICLTSAAALIINAAVTDQLPEQSEFPLDPLDSLLQFFPSLADLPGFVRLTLEATLFSCLCIPPICTALHFYNDRNTARQHRNEAQQKLKEAHNETYEEQQKNNKLKAKNAGLHAGYLFITNNPNVPKKVQKEFSQRIQEAKKACREQQKQQQKKKSRQQS